MNQIEVAGGLDRLGTAYRQQVPPELVEVWCDHLSGVDVDVAIDAAENIIGIETFFPTLAALRNEIAAVHRQRRRDALNAPPADGGPNRDCQLCHGLVWYEVEPILVVNQQTAEVTHDSQWKPCQFCDGAQYDAWMRANDERSKRQARKAKRPESYTTNITELLAEARAALKAGTQ